MEAENSKGKWINYCLPPLCLTQVPKPLKSAGSGKWGTPFANIQNGSQKAETDGSYIQMAVQQEVAVIASVKAIINKKLFEPVENLDEAH